MSQQTFVPDTGFLNCSSHHSDKDRLQLTLQTTTTVVQTTTTKSSVQYPLIKIKPVSEQKVLDLHNYPLANKEIPVSLTKIFLPLEQVHNTSDPCTSNQAPNELTSERKSFPLHPQQAQKLSSPNQAPNELTSELKSFPFHPQQAQNLSLPNQASSSVSNNISTVKDLPFNQLYQNISKTPKYSSVKIKHIHTNCPSNQTRSHYEQLSETPSSSNSSSFASNPTLNKRYIYSSAQTQQHYPSFTATPETANINFPANVFYNTATKPTNQSKNNISSAAITCSICNNNKECSTNFNTKTSFPSNFAHNNSFTCHSNKLDSADINNIPSNPFNQNVLDLSSEPPYNDYFNLDQSISSQNDLRLYDIPNIIDFYQDLPKNIQMYILAQMMKRSHRSVLHFCQNMVTGVLKRDFLKELPLELSQKIMLFMDKNALCRASQINKHYFKMFETHQSLLAWKHRAIVDGFVPVQSKVDPQFANEIGLDLSLEFYEIQNFFNYNYDSFSKSFDNDSVNYSLDSINHNFIAKSQANILPFTDNSIKINQSNNHQIVSTALDFNSILKHDFCANSNPHLEPHSNQNKKETDTQSLNSSLCNGDGSNYSKSPNLPQSHAQTQPYNNADFLLSSEQIDPNQKMLQKFMSSLSEFENKMLLVSSAHSETMKSTNLNSETQESNTVKNKFKEYYRRKTILEKRWREGKAKIFEFPGIGADVVTCIYISENKIVASFENNIIMIYNIENGKLLMQLKGHGGGVWALSLVGNMLVSGSTDRTVRIWDIQTGKCLKILYGHHSTIRCLKVMVPKDIRTSKQIKNNMKPVYSPISPLIVTGSRDNTLRVWEFPIPLNKDNLKKTKGDLANDRNTNLNNIEGDNINSNNIEGDNITSNNTEGDNITSNNIEGEDPGDNTRNNIRVDLNGNENENNDIGADNLAMNEPKFILSGHTQSVRAIDYVGNIIISGSYDSTLRLWCSETGKCLHVLNGHTEKVYAVATDEESRTIYSGSLDGTVRAWSLDSGECIEILRGHTDLVGILVLKTCNFWCDFNNSGDSTECKDYNSQNPNIDGVRNSNSTRFGNVEANMNRDCDREDKDALKNEKLLKFRNGKHVQLISAGADSNLQLWNAESRKLLATMKGHEGPISAIDNTHSLLISAGDSTVKLWDLRSCSLIRNLVEKVLGIWQVKADERRLVVALRKSDGVYFRVFDFGFGLKF
ncbi:hypothetical protein BB561_004590 [Smittium simulii]|uniref:F-box domain-containing protein n=1 Tax=Smittium simulii TaxID=133385 RepID=A0A2T9YFB6_9FUNG|nr:hypothetical protein BB561_004590 [Smittium simulii]